MTGLSTGRLDTGKLALGVAAIVLVVAVGFALNKGDGKDQSTAPAALAANGAVDPIVALQAKAAQNPGDNAAWKALGDEYFNRGSFGDAVQAFEKAARISPSIAVLWSSLGEARVMASENDPLPAEALADFQRAVAIDPREPRARYFLAVKKDIGGDHQGAIADWLALLRDSPASAPWKDDLRRTIEQVGKINAIDVAGRMAAAERMSSPAVAAAPGLPGPSAQDLAAAAAIPPSQQREMAEGMVARLEARLKTQPGNIDGWVMLMRSRVNLAQPDKASAALRDALAANPGQADQLRSAAQQLGVRQQITAPRSTP